MKKPAHEIDDNALFQKACALLARREHSARELGDKLVKHASPERVAALIERLAERGLQSDERFAEQLCRSWVNAGKGPLRIRAELRRAALTDELIAHTLDAYRNRWPELAEAARSKKFGPEVPRDFPAWARQARFLTQRGFGERDLPARPAAEQ